MVSAGADGVDAPGLMAADDIRQGGEAVDTPVNVLLLPGGPDVAALATLGVAPGSAGSAFYSARLAALQTAALELKDQGAHGC